MLHDLDQKNLHINELIFLQNPKKPYFLVIHEKFMRSFKIQEKFQKSPMSHFRGKKVYLLTY